MENQLDNITILFESTSLYAQNKSFAVFVSARQKKRLWTDGPTDRLTDGPTDQRTDQRRTDGWRDRWTHPLIESWLTTKKQGQSP